jgi:hypothetical protein
MDLVSEEHEAKLEQIRQKRLHRFGKTAKVADAKKAVIKDASSAAKAVDTKATPVKPEAKTAAKANKETH